MRLWYYPGQASIKPWQAEFFTSRMHTDVTYVIGALIAFLSAGVTVLYDCHVSIQDRLKRVPMPIYKTPEAVCLASVCGIVAAVAYRFTNGAGTSLVDSVLSLKQTDPYLRGLCVGLTVLVLIRSKLFSVKGAEVGGELVYNFGRVWVMQSLNTRWQTFKAEFNKRNQAAALAIPNYEGQLLAALSGAIKVQPEEFRIFVDSQVKNVQSSRPTPAFSTTDPFWQMYYATLTNLALDYAGRDVFKGWTSFVP
jgi:hypothetical protein